MIQLDRDTLRKLQMTELELLQEVKRICEKYNITYTIIGGTLLGAVRHGGFIPWDDDADVAMLRTEYEKFRMACKTELDPQKFYFQEQRDTPGYRWGYGKLRRKGTQFIREHQEHMLYEQGVFIDIFPHDNVPDNYIVRCVQNFHCFCIRKTLWAAVGKEVEKNICKRKIYEILYKIPEEKIYQHYYKYVEKCNHRETKLVRPLLFPTSNRKYGYARKWYEETDKIIFEGIEFQGVSDRRGWLEFEFGDYMRLPPKEKRKVHPVSAIELLN